jgi:hypothetical protein
VLILEALSKHRAAISSYGVHIGGFLGSKVQRRDEEAMMKQRESCGPAMRICVGKRDSSSERSVRSIPDMERSGVAMGRCMSEQMPKAT